MNLTNITEINEMITTIHAAKYGIDKLDAN